MKRRDFLHLAGLGLGGTMLAGIPIIGHAIPLEAGWSPGDVALKKQLADVALNAARSKGATWQKAEGVRQEAEGVR